MDILEEEQKEETSSNTAIRLGVLLGILALSVFVFSTELFNAQPVDSGTASVITSVENVDPFEHLSIEAKSAFVYDLTTGEVLFSKNETAQLPLASLTKIMTALVASELVTSPQLLTLTDEDIDIEGDNGLKSGEKWRFTDLLDYTLLVSSNDGAHAIAGVAGATLNTGEGAHASFIEHMNQEAQALGLSQTFFLNESGLDTNEVAGGGYGSARDVAILLSTVLRTHPRLLEATTFDTLTFVSEDAFIYNATNTNTALDRIPGIIASKTGFTDLAGGNLAVAFDAGINRPVVAVVLGSSFEGRFDDMGDIVYATLKKGSR